jgi:hypothetical protein
MKALKGVIAISLQKSKQGRNALKGFIISSKPTKVTLENGQSYIITNKRPSGEE